MNSALIITSVASMIDQFNIPNIEILQKLGYEVHVAANFLYGNTISDERIFELKNLLKSRNVIVHDVPFNRNVFSIGNLKAYIKIKEIINTNFFSIIHCQSPIGGVIGRLAVRKRLKKGSKIIYTAHGFHFYKGASIFNWFLYYPVEFIFSKLTDLLITINSEDFNFAKKKFPGVNVHYIPGVGVDTCTINELKIDSIKKRKNLEVPENAILVLSVGELNKNKNHEVIIRALAEIDNKNIYYVICGKGQLHDYLISLCNSLGIKDRVLFLGYRSDIHEIMKVSDIFVLPSYREGLSVSLLEAMSAELPVVCSDIRGNKDVIMNGKGGFLLNPNDVIGFAAKICELSQDEALRKYCGTQNAKKIVEFDRRSVDKMMLNIYENVCRT